MALYKDGEEAVRGYKDGAKLYRAYYNGDKVWHSGDLVPPVISSALDLETVEYAPPSSQASVGDSILWTGVISTGIAIGTRSRLAWAFDDANSVVLKRIYNSATSVLATLAGNARTWEFPYPVSTAVSTYRAEGTNLEGTSHTDHAGANNGVHTVVLELAKLGLATSGQTPLTPGQTITGHPVAEFRTNGIISRVRMNANGQEGRYEDQTQHTTAQYVTGTGASPNAGYKMTSGVGLTLSYHQDGWHPPLRLRVELQGSTKTLDVSQRIVT